MPTFPLSFPVAAPRALSPKGMRPLAAPSAVRSKPVGRAARQRNEVDLRHPDTLGAPVKRESCGLVTVSSRSDAHSRAFPGYGRPMTGRRSRRPRQRRLRPRGGRRGCSRSSASHSAPATAASRPSSSSSRTRKGVSSSALLTPPAERSAEARSRFAGAISSACARSSDPGRGWLGLSASRRRSRPAQLHIEALQPARRARRSARVRRPRGMRGSGPRRPIRATCPPRARGAASARGRSRPR